MRKWPTSRAPLNAVTSLSQQVINLERELGQPLLERLGKKVRLTEAGKLFYDRAVTILRSVDDAQREIREMPEGGGTVSIGAIPTIAPYFLPSLVASLRMQFPRTEVVIQEDFTAQLITSCRAGDLDCGVLGLPVASEPLETEALFEEELLLAVASDHRLVRQKRVTMENVGLEPFVLLSELHCLGEQVVSFCKQQSCLPTISCRSAQLLTIQELVASGHGVSLIPAMAAAQDRSPSRAYRSLSGSRPTRTIGLIWHGSRCFSPVVQNVLVALRAYAQQFVATKGGAAMKGKVRRRQ